MTGVVVGGAERACAVPITTWHERPELAFPGLRHRPITRAVIVHHTGGEGDAAQVHRTLTARGLSVHFHIDHLGQVTQYADTETRCSHAGRANGWSVGIEIQNRANSVALQRGIRRELVLERIQGEDVKRTTLLPAQVASAIALLETLCAAYDLPWRVPMWKTDVFASVLDATALEQYRGILGHLHVNVDKVDPGVAMLRAIAAHPLRGRDGAAE